MNFALELDAVNEEQYQAIIQVKQQYQTFAVDQVQAIAVRPSFVGPQYKVRLVFNEPGIQGIKRVLDLFASPAERVA